MRRRKIVITEPMQVYNLVARVNRDGIKAVAAQLECHPTVLTRWLDVQGYVMIRTWENAKVLEQTKAVQNASK